MLTMKRSMSSAYIVDALIRNDFSIMKKFIYERMEFGSLKKPVEKQR